MSSNPLATEETGEAEAIGHFLFTDAIVAALRLANDELASLQR